jgi:hypothetical protein
MRTGTSLHADQASRTLLEKRKQLAATKLTAHENPTVLIDTMNLKDTLCEVYANCGKFGHGWLLCSGRQHPNYGVMRRREQEPSTASVETIAPPELVTSALVALLIPTLVERGVLSSQDAREIYENALLLIELQQGNEPGEQRIYEAARELIEAHLR